jgi:two-component system, LytTR family, response regulator
VVTAGRGWRAVAEPLRVVVVDDERQARERIRRVLERSSEGIEIVALCATAEEAVKAIADERPDLVLLDVEIPGSNGFGVVERVGAGSMPFTIFVTAYDTFAVRAFEVNAVDYVLKPFTDERLLEAVERARLRITERDVGSLHALLRYAAGSRSAAKPAAEPGAEQRAQVEGLASGGEDGPDACGGPLHRLVVRKQGRVLVVPTGVVDWIEAAGPYAELHCGGERHLVRMSMALLEARLDPRRFVRIHRSTIVNLERVAELQEHVRGEYFLMLHDGTRLRLSRSRRVHLEQVLGQRL